MWGTTVPVHTAVLQCISQISSLLNQHNTTFIVDAARWADHVDVQEMADPFSSRSHSPPSAPWSSLPSSSSLHGVLWHQFTPLLRWPRTIVDGMTFSNQPDCGETTIDRNSYGVNDSPVPLLQEILRVIHPPKNAAASSCALAKSSPQSNTRHVPKNGQARRRPLARGTEHQILP